MKPQAPFTSITDKILFDNRVTPIELKVYLLICQAAYGKKTFSYPSQNRLALLCNYSRQHVNQAIQHLVEYGYLRIIRNGRKSNNVYEITLFERTEVLELKNIVEASIAKSMEDDVNSGLHQTQYDVKPSRHRDVNYSRHDDSNDVVSSRHDDVNSTLQEALQMEATQSFEATQSALGSFQKTKTSSDSKNESLFSDTFGELFSDKKEKSNLGSHSESFDLDEWKILFDR
jgi:hypothetical protein